MHRLNEVFSKGRILFPAFFLFFAGNALGQVPEKAAKKADEKTAAKTEEPLNAAQIELLETKYRFETNGDSRKEVHALVKINSELGVRQFARLNFDYNRGYQSIEIPLVRVTHASGGTADILQSAITDLPNPAVEKFPAYQDVRVKSVRILGLQPGDLLEYRVVTTTTKPPLAPDFWLEHSFDRTGVVTKQILELDLPSASHPQLGVSTAIPSATIENVGESRDARHTYHWTITTQLGPHAESSEADIVITTYASWEALAEKLTLLLMPGDSTTSGAWQKASELVSALPTPEKKFRAVYDFVSQKIATVDVPLGSSGFRTRAPADILASGYASPEDKIALFQSLVKFFEKNSIPALTGSEQRLSSGLPTPSALNEPLVIVPIAPPPSPDGTQSCSDCSDLVWLDPALEVAPFGVLPASLRGKEALTDRRQFLALQTAFLVVPTKLPFASVQRVTTNASLSLDGKLTANVKYELRGDNELLLRVTFHQTPKEKQLQIAQYLALSDGFRGKVASVKTSDPSATETPFEVEYEITQEKFVDWSKKPVRIPALLPLPGLPDVTKKLSANSRIELGPPLDIQLTGTLRLPAGVTAQAPAGTSVKRDYATFSSEYSAKKNLIHASRHLDFLAPEIASDRSIDLNAFLHAVQSDQSQLFVLEKPETAPPAKPK